MIFMNINDLIAIVKKKLINEIVIEKIEIEDKSFLHKNHSGHQEGKFHLKLLIRSKELKDLNRIESDKKIRVNAISAGPIKTLAASAIGDAKFLYKWNENHSFLKRNVDIHDVGNSALYLLSYLAGGVTGEIHYVDAGYNKVGMPDPKNIT